IVVGEKRDGERGIVLWVQGFPKQNIDFIDNSTICYTCGNYLIFVNIENEKRYLLQCMSGKVGALATNIPFQVVAFSDRKLKPSIYIYTFPELNRKAKLKGHAQLDYALLEFSYCGTYMASYSAIPEYELMLWNWEKRIILCSRLQPGVEVSQMTFNPMNWQQMCLSSASALTIWNIERSDKTYYLKSVNLPAEDGTYICEPDGMFTYTEVKDTIYGPELLLSSIAGLVGIEAETFKPKDDLHPLVHPTTHCWNSTNELYVSCEEGHVLLINAENLLVTVLSRIAQVPQDTSINTMAFHREGLFVSGNDGIVHSFIVKEVNYTVKDYFDVQEPIGNIIFSPDYKLLLIETIKGSVYTYSFDEEPKVETILDAYDGYIQAVDFITPGNKYCMSVTILGEICIWLLENGSHVSKLHLRTEVNDMACCPSSLSVAVGTNEGYIQFLDVTDVALPQVAHSVFLTRSSIQHVHYDQKGQYLITGTSDGHIFILNANPSQLFEVLGFTEINDYIEQMSVIYISETKLLEVMVFVKTSESEKSRLEIFFLPEATLRDPGKCCNERGRLKNDFFERKIYEINHPLTSVLFDLNCEQLYGYCSHVPYICSYDIPKKVFFFIVLQPKIKMQSRHFGTGILCLSSHGKWLASTAKDGILSIRDINNLETFAQIQCHSYQAQGIRSLAFSLDGRSILANGREDGTLIKKFKGKKNEIKEGMKTLAKIIQKMMEENDLAPEIAQLEQQEYTLDIEEMKKLYDENDKEEAKIRKETEMGNLAKLYLWNILKEECWDSMTIKGQGLMSFHTKLKVQNFPMKERTPEELKELETVLRIRKLEVAELKLREQILEAPSSASLLTPVKSQEEEEEEDDEEEDEVEEEEVSTPFYLLGSLCTSFTTNTDMLNSQLELHTREEKINQIILLKDIIYQVKIIFNREFDATFEQKKLEIARVREKNIRIQEIIMDLDLGEEVWQPEIEDCEKPDLILTVEDNEVLFTPCHYVIPQPSFMVSKVEEVWNDDERKRVKEYEKKVKELNEEKEKYKKSLDAELKKIQGSIEELTQAFDDNLKKLFERKVLAEMVINQEELKIANLIFSLVLDEELNTRELGLNNFLERKQTAKKNTSKEVFVARDEVDTYRENYDNLVAEDKVIERGFKKEFVELSSHHAEILIKLFKRRPRMAKQRVQIESTTPFGTRIGSERLKKDNLAQIMKAMDDLDNVNHMPEGLDPGIWQYFCAARRTKIENEQRVKRKAAGLLEMQAFLRRRIEEDEKIQSDIDKIFQELFVLQKDRSNYQMDLTVQFLLKQGQVETEDLQFMIGFSDFIIINRSIIEDLNKAIRTQGMKKVANLVEKKNYQKGISQIEWDHKKMEMEMEDLTQRSWDIQMLFFSRAHQRYISEDDHEITIGFQISQMEQSLAALEKKHKKDVEFQKRLFKDLRKINTKKDIANYILSCNLHEHLVCNSERKHICQSFGLPLTYEKISRERNEATLQQQKLINISKEQFEQISILQAEVERLRMKTFPALIHM
uniref:Cilia- and flagella-associated protein 43 n=1 Tax=Sarcophilus harrisii TaxID=9305 RepID=A0A7N4P5G4_SARHA